MNFVISLAFLLSPSTDTRTCNTREVAGITYTDCRDGSKCESRVVGDRVHTECTLPGGVRRSCESWAVGNQVFTSCRQ